MNKSVFERLLHRAPTSHKYDFGHVLVVGGSPGMVGAAFLSARAALRVGAGLVSIASSPAVIDKLEKRVEEIMTLRLSASAQALLPFIKDRKVSVVVIGPGLKPDLAVTALKQLKGINLPIVIDGGALTAVQQTPELIPKGSILTPHLGEFQRFFEAELPKDPASLRQTAMRFAHQNDIILLLKGHQTGIFSRKGRYETLSGGPELATAGTGDVLSGMIAGIIAQKISSEDAAEAAVQLHGLAGEMAAQAKTEPGVIASDVIEAIPAALKLVLDREL
ncbi:MAG TPA: NAD(P)H-hydrate dehydratase [Candidatus Saccharimonadales bacterium]|jgi:NAD(P)H-hydrate epimerase|nr:NAD(P)H-hydrate dehydratase [Candidatus Saccharimonadales bacterium]